MDESTQRVINRVKEEHPDWTEQQIQDYVSEFWDWCYEWNGEEN